MGRPNKQRRAAKVRWKKFDPNEFPEPEMTERTSVEYHNANCGDQKKYQNVRDTIPEHDLRVHRCSDRESLGETSVTHQGANFRNRNQPYEYVVRGTSHQGDRYRYKCPGIQCTYMAFIALIKLDLKDANFWTTHDVDNILSTGDTFFFQHFHNIIPHILMVRELPSNINVFNVDYTVQFCNELVGVINASNVCLVNNVVVSYSLDQAISELFTNSSYGLLVCAGQTVAIAKRSDMYYVFDSHSRNECGLHAEKGTAILISFSNLYALQQHVTKLFAFVRNEQFEIVPIHFGRSQNAIEQTREYQQQLYLERQYSNKTRKTLSAEETHSVSPNERTTSCYTQGVVNDTISHHRTKKHKQTPTSDCINQHQTLKRHSCDTLDEVLCPENKNPSEYDWAHQFNYNKNITKPTQNTESAKDSNNRSQTNKTDLLGEQNSNVPYKTFSQRNKYDKTENSSAQALKSSRTKTHLAMTGGVNEKQGRKNRKYPMVAFNYRQRDELPTISVHKCDALDPIFYPDEKILHDPFDVEQQCENQQQLQTKTLPCQKINDISKTKSPISDTTNQKVNKTGQQPNIQKGCQITQHKYKTRQQPNTQKGCQITQHEYKTRQQPHTQKGCQITQHEYKTQQQSNTQKGCQITQHEYKTRQQPNTQTRYQISQHEYETRQRPNTQKGCQITQHEYKTRKKPNTQTGYQMTQHEFKTRQQPNTQTGCQITQREYKTQQQPNTQKWCQITQHEYKTRQKLNTQTGCQITQHEYKTRQQPNTQRVSCQKDNTFSKTKSRINKTNQIINDNIYQMTLPGCENNFPQKPYNATDTFNKEQHLKQRDLSLYWDDQKQKNALFQEKNPVEKKSKSSHRRSYMKEYIKNLRQMKTCKQHEKFESSQTLHTIRKRKLNETSADNTICSKKPKITNYIEQEKSKNRERMKHSRKTKKFHDNENDKNKQRIQNYRKSKKFRKSENDRNVERMQDIRQNENYREKEKSHNVDRMQNYRKSDKFRECENDKNVERMQNIRKNESYREQEKSHNVDRIQNYRKSGKFRECENDKSVERMQNIRKNENYREQEKSHNVDRIQNYRKSDKFRECENDKNVERMQNIRQNENYREQEKSQNVDRIQNYRKSENFCESERDKNVGRMHGIRLNENYRNQENILNLERVNRYRESLAYVTSERKTNAKRKRELRSDDFYREQERVKKKQKRIDDREVLNESYREKKREKRKHQEYRQREELNRLRRKRETTLNDSIASFENSTSESATYICSCCHQLLFRESVKETGQIGQCDQSLLNKCLTGTLSVKNQEWICLTCLQNIKKGEIPKISVVNGMKFPEKPPELFLSNLEERLVALRIPFMQIRTLGAGGQYSLKGSIVNVPAQIEPTVRVLPRNMEKSAVIPVRLKRMMQMNHAHITENVRPTAVLEALQKLVETSDLYKDAEIKVDFEWNQNPNPNSSKEQHEEHNESDSDSDNFSEVDEHENNSLSTLLDEPDTDPSRIISVAPGEGQHPISLYRDPDSEYLAFPTVFCGQRRPHNSERLKPVYYSDICKWELRSSDRRAAVHIPSLFFKMKKLQCQHVSGKVNLAVRRCKTKGKQYTAGYILNDNMGESLVKLDEGYRIFRSLRNSPQFWECKKKEIFAMIRQLGIPTLFIYLSANDLHWPELIKALGILIDKKDYTHEIQTKTLSWETRTRLVQSDPVTCVRHFDHRMRQYINLVLRSPQSPIGTMTDFFYRVEFQQRGSPHIHMLAWVEGAPVYNGENDQEICDYVDKVASCSSDVADSEQPFLDFQRHKHSRTCRKGGSPVCRFGIPYPPMKCTTVVHPYEGDKAEEYKKKYQEIQKALNNLKEDITFDRFIEQLKLTEEDYMIAVSTSVKATKIFLRRKPNENRINPYMKGQLGFYRANHDIQVVLDAYACAVYIVDYISKSAKGMSQLMAEACKEAKKGNKTLKESVRHIGNKFLNSSEVSAQEAAYLVLQLNLANKSRQCVFIPTAPPSERIFLLKSKKDLEELPENSTDIESDNLLKKYARRPKALEKLCLADYASKLVSVSKQNITEKESTRNKHSDEESDQDFHDDSEEESLDCAQTKGTAFYYITSNGFKIKMRSNPRLIRYVRYNVSLDPENYYREQLLLYHPWRDEIVDLINGYESFKQHYIKLKTSIETKQLEYEPSAHHLTDIENEINDYENENFDEIAPNTQSVEANDADNPVLPAQEFSFYYPDRREHSHFDLAADLGLTTHIPNNEVELLQGRLPDDQYFTLLSQLNEKQREVFNHVMHTVLYRPQDTLRIFISGGAGVGKSVVIRVLYQALHRHYCSNVGQNPEYIRIAVCAFTGLAAYNVQGSTIHTAFGIEPNKQLNYKPLSDEKRNTMQVKYRELSVVIIDEVSMLGNKMFKFLYQRLQEIKHNYNEPFGGVHVILVGDLFQLRPVCDGWIFQDCTQDYNSLAPNLWKQYFHMFELDKIMRQKDDREFACLLNRLREGNQNETDMNKLKACSVQTTSSKYEGLKNVTHLFCRNVDVDHHNITVYESATTAKAEILSIDTVKGDSSDQVKERILLAVKSAATSKTANLLYKLNVAVGLTYETSHNVDQEDGICNGSPCVLKKIDYLQENNPVPSCLWVKFFDPKTGTDTRKKYRLYFKSGIENDWTPVWAIKRTFKYAGKYVVRQQFPLKPSAAKTVHKAQGQTKSQVVIELSKATQPHLHYVAYSRVTNMSGLHLLNGVSGKIKVSQDVIAEVQRLRNESALKLCYRPLYSFNNCIKAVFQNVQSMNRHYPLVCNDKNFITCDVIALAETKLRSHHEDSEYCIPGFQPIIRSDQPISLPNSKAHHGLAIYVRENHDILLKEQISTQKFESLHVKITDSHFNITWSVVVIYNQPNGSQRDFRTNIEKVEIFNLSNNLLIFGDFNFNINDGNEWLLRTMKRSFPTTNQIVSFPTTDFHTTLDLAFTSMENAFAEIIACVWSYHHTLGVIMPL